LHFLAEIFNHAIKTQHEQVVVSILDNANIEILLGGLLSYHHYRDWKKIIELKKDKITKDKISYQNIFDCVIKSRNENAVIYLLQNTDVKISNELLNII
jgi:hypothetical protein